jgi:hypothetical protein
MKIIIDECVPHIVKKLLPERNIKTVQEIGWDGIKSGELLKLVEADFELFITSDKNLQHQQNLQNFDLAFLLLPSNQVPLLEAMISLIDKAIGEIQSGEFREL